MVFYRKLAEIAGQYLKKGSAVYIEGKLKTRKWTDKEGVERYTTEIEASEMKMLGGRRDGSDADAPTVAPSGEQPEPRKAGGKPSFDDLDDDIPF